jgi:Subtilase family
VAGDFGYSPEDLHSAYQLPTSSSGTQTIALVDAYNDLTAEEDLAAYSREFGLPECTAASGCFKKVDQAGGTASLPFPQTQAELTNAETLCGEGERRRSPTQAQEEACYLVEEADGWGVEISLDIETAHGICQNCHIVLVEAESPTYTDLETAEESAARLGVNEISNSWGGPECARGLGCMEDSSAFNHPGIVITAAAGDRGYRNWLEEPPVPYANFPASSPQVVAVGGTSLSLGTHGEWAGETVWNDGGESEEGFKEGYGASGGGCSVQFTAQPWQQSVSDWSDVGCGGKRAVADVSADADPYTGVAVRDSSPDCEYAYEEDDVIHVLHWCMIGGTSLATPLIAATYALAGGSRGVEYPAKTLYEDEIDSPESLHDVTVGSNGECLAPFDEVSGLSGCTPAEEGAKSCSSEAICLARTGYDGPTGVGTPDGIAGFTPSATPPPSARPAIDEESASHITQHDATIEAQIDPEGLQTEYEIWIADPCQAPTECIRDVVVARGSVPAGATEEYVSVDLAASGAKLNIEPGTRYGYQVLATNAAGETEGELQTFTTTPPDAPTVLTGGASATAQTSATVGATVDPNGAEVSECAIEYGTTTSYGYSAPCSPSPGSGSSPITVNASLTGLVADTTYHFRIVATNAGGTNAGGDQTFTTQPATTFLQQTPGEQGPMPKQVTSSVPGQGVSASQTRKTRPVPDAELASTSLTASSSGTVFVEVSCPAAETSCAGTVTLRTLSAVSADASAHDSKEAKASILTLASGPFKVAGGRATRVKLRLSAEARALLARGHVLRARATVFARDPAGTTYTAQTTVTIRPAQTARGPKG